MSKVNRRRSRVKKAKVIKVRQFEGKTGKSLISDKWELLLQSECGEETYRTDAHNVTLDECVAMLREYNRMFPNGYPILQPLLLPLLANGASQFPDAEPYVGFGRAKKGGAK